MMNIIYPRDTIQACWTIDLSMQPTIAQQYERLRLEALLMRSLVYAYKPRVADNPIWNIKIRGNDVTMQLSAPVIEGFISSTLR